MGPKDFRKSKNKGSFSPSNSSTVKSHPLPSSVMADQIDQTTPTRDLFSSLVFFQRMEILNLVLPVSDEPKNIPREFLLWTRDFILPTFAILKPFLNPI